MSITKLSKALTGVALALCATSLLAGDFKVTLLGTGVPNPRPERFSQSTLIEAGSQKLIIDIGRGTAIRVWQAGVPMGSIDAHFITHFHSDHTSGIPDLWLTGWLRPQYAQRTSPFVIYGPTGIKKLMNGLQLAYDDDIKIRLEDEKNPPEGIAVEAYEFEAPAVVYEKDGVKVTSFEVDHGDVIKPAVGYRVDYDGRSVVISGDTRLSDNVIEQSKDVDILIHEVAAIKPELLKKSSAFQRIFAHHVSPEQAGTVFEQAKPKMAVYSHIARYDDAEFSAPTDEDIINATRKTYAGPLVVGVDLMQFDIGKEGISISVLPASK